MLGGGGCSGWGPFWGPRSPGSGRAEALPVVGGVVGVVRVVVWELHSGREHLIFIAAMITPLAWCGGAENVVIFDARTCWPVLPWGVGVFVWVFAH